MNSNSQWKKKKNKILKIIPKKNAVNKIDW
jgi:hypothetical protein